MIGRGHGGELASASYEAGKVLTQPVPRVALTREEAAASLSMSLDSFEKYVQPNIRMLRLGRLRLVPVSELESWCGQQAKRTVAA